MRRFVFLARPRRFGKSLLCNTFKAYFQGKKQLFEGLKIMEFEKGWKTYPVLHFDMSDLKNYSIPEAKSNLEGQQDDRRVTKCGVTISSDARNITHWRVVDAEGKVIVEQKF